MSFFFQLMILVSAFQIFVSRNPVHSVLFLIAVFVNGSGLLLLSGLEFLSLVLLVVYVGAIAVLFLFIVMMMNLKTVELRQSLLSYYPFGLMVLVIFFLQLLYLFDDLWFVGTEYVDWTVFFFQELNVKQIGQVLYTYYGVPFLLSSYLLLVGMIGAIYLTYIEKNRLKKQKIYEQVARMKKNSLTYYR
jgi:NADH-quinone oxidoreductase subunit J